MFRVQFASDVIPGDTLSTQNNVADVLINTCTFSGTTITVASSHNLAANQQVRFTTTGTLPSPLFIFQYYFVLSTGLTATQLNIATTSGGSPITFSGGTGIHSILKNLEIITIINHGEKIRAIAIEGDPSFETWGILS